MGSVVVKHEVTMTVYGTCSVEDLGTFLGAIQQAGLQNASLTWTAHPGDQREPGSLTLTARPGARR